MLLLDRQKTAATPGRASLNRVQLRLRADGQLLELPMGKTTIGSSPRCNLRLQQPGVQPLHCLIVHGPEGLSVRRWAKDTQLNGRAFDDAPLAEGDCLALGGVELELVPSQSAVVERSKLAETADWTPPPGVVRDDALLESVEESVAAIESWQESPATFETEVVEVTAAAEVTVELAADEADAAELDGMAALWGKRVELKLLPSPARIAEQALSTETGAWTPALDEVTNVLAELVEESADETFEEKVSWECEPTELDIEQVEAVVPYEPQPEPVISAWDTSDTFDISARDAAEEVFQALQVACATSRGRSRKLLAALRGTRTEYTELAARLNATEQQLSDLKELRTAWEQSKAGHSEEQHELSLELQELRRQIAELESRVAEQAQRLSDLQQELAATQIHEAPMAPVAEDVIDDSPHLAGLTSRQPVAEDVEARLTGAVSPIVATPASEAPVAHETSHDWTIQPASDAWSTRLNSFTNSGEPLESLRQSRSWDESVASPTPPVESEKATAAESAAAEHTAWPSEAAVPTDEVSASEEPVADDSDTNPFAEFSIWKQGAKPESAKVDEVDAPVATPVAEPTWGSHSFGDEEGESARVASANELEPAAAIPSPWAVPAEAEPSAVAQAPREKVKPTSYLEKYSHLFAEEGEKETPAVVAPIPSLASTPLNSALRKSDVLRNENNGSKSSTGDDEESIEQYMAKLLQRVRGDGPAIVGSQAAPSTPVADVEVSSVPAKSMSLQHLASGDNDRSDDESREPMSDDEATAELATWDVSKRRAAMPPASSNLESLRALANETARRAIGRHELVKHRRNTVTRVIVASLAGMTGLWLMMEAPNWRDMQFIAGGVLMLVAAYWAGQSLRMWFESMRAAAYDGPESYLDESDLAHQTGLPIDVEDRF